MAQDATDWASRSLKFFHLRLAEAVRPDFAARRAFYASDLASRGLETTRATSRLVLEGERFGAVLTFFASEDDALRAEERLGDLRAELERAIKFGEFRQRFDLRGVVLGAIRVGAAEVGAPALVGVGRVDPPPPVPGQQTLFLTRLRASDGTEALVHVGSAPPRDRWPDAEFLERAIVVHVDHADAMP